MHAFFGGGLRFSRRASSFSLGFCAGAQFVRQQMLESGLPKRHWSTSRERSVDSGPPCSLQVLQQKALTTAQAEGYGGL